MWKKFLKIKTAIIIMLISLLCSFAVSAADNKERSIDFNDSWKFIQSDVNSAESKNYNDSSWKTLNLPHDWSIGLNFNTNSRAGQTAGFLDGGTGWYRKTFTLTDDMKNKHITVDFDGVMAVATVYINGNEVGHNYYGYTTFSVDISDYITDGENVIAVKVVNRQPSSRWYTGSGIYRNVKMTVTDMIYVDTNGTYITTPTLEEDLKENKAQINIKTDIINKSGSEKDITLNTKILGKEGNTVAESTDKDFNQTITVSNPKLWSVDNPYLYTAESNVIIDGNIVDTYKTTFGLRYTKFDANEGFSLNGEYMKLKGVCLHHDLGALGAAENTRAIERQLDMMKDMGVNAIRSSHNPASKTMVELCNKKGLMLIEEAFDMWSMRKTNYDYAGAGYFKLYAEDDAKKMVERDKNDPCVIMWSIGNEITWAEDNLESAEKLINAVKSVDTTRPVTMNENHYTTEQGQQLMDMVDVVGYSYAPDSQYVKDHKNHPDWVLFGLEIGSHMESRGVYYDPTQKKQVDYDELQCTAYDIQQPDVRWGETVAEGWKFDRDNKFVLGEFVWTGFDYIGEPTPYMNYSMTDIDGNTIIPKSSYVGIVDTAGIPKDSYYLYQSQWTDKPMVHILPHWNWDNGEKVQVWAYTNADEVELFLNGKSLGTKKFEKKTTDYGMEYKETSDGDIYLSWEVPFEEGELKAVAYIDGKVVAEDFVKTAGSAQSVKLTPDRRVIDGDGKDLSFVTVDIVDNQGVVVPNADNLVNFEVENGEIAGVDNGNAATFERYQDNKRKAFNGKAMLIVKSDGSGKPIKITASSSGLNDGKATVYLSDENVQDKTLLEILPTSVTTKKGTEPSLPKKVTAVYSDGTESELDVTWDSIAKEKYNTAGNFTVEGALIGTEQKAQAVIYVIDIVATEPFTDVTEVGKTYTLPDTVNLVYSDSSKVKANVAWEQVNSSAYDTEGIVTVNGTVSETDIPAKAYIRVASLSQGYTETNIAREGKAGASYTGDGSAEPINDGVISYANSPKNRWSNWVSKTETRTEDYVSISWDEKKTMNSAKIYFATSSQASGVVPDSISVTYKDSDGKYQNVPNVTENSETVSGGTITTFAFDDITTDEIRVNMTNNSGSKCICVTEIEINGKTIKPNDSAKLSDIKVNSISVDGFKENQYNYNITLPFDTSTPEVIAYSKDNARIVVVPSTTKSGIYKIMVTSESRLISTVYNVSVQIENAPIKSAEISVDSENITEDETYDISMTVLDELNNNISKSAYSTEYDISNNKVVYIKDGKLYALSEGSTKITAKVTYMGKTVTSNTLNINVAKADYDKVIIGFENVKVSTDVGNAPILPDTVTAKYDRGFSNEVDVVWDNIDKEQYSKYGKFTISGTVKGTDTKPKAEVEVVGVIAVQNASTGTIIHEKPELPENVTVYYSNGEQVEKKVEWEDISEDMYSQTGEFTVKGDIEGVKLNSTATVRVTDEYIRGLDLSARKNGYHYPEITASNTYSGDDIEYAINEIISYTNSPKDRWSDYKDSSENVWIEFVLGYEEETEFYLDDVTIHYFKDKYGSGAPNTMQIQYWDSASEEWIDVNNQSETSENVDGDSNTSGIVTTYEFDKVKTSRLRFNMTKDTDKCVAITEIKFYSDYMEKYDTDTLDDIKINGESIADFNSDIFNYEFEYEGDKIPEITASATDNAAVTVVPATEDNPTAKIFVVSESGVNTRTYTIRMNNGKERLKQIESLDDNLEIYLVENESTENAPKFKIINHSDNAQTIRLYVAGYNSGRLMDISADTVQIEPSGTQYVSTEIDNNDRIQEYKFFIWDNNNVPKTQSTTLR